MKGNWWRAPQRVWLRRAIFQVHLWIGLLLTLYAVVIGVSGSALVFREEIENFSEGALLHVDAQRSPRRLDQAVHAISAERPKWTAVGLEYLERGDKAPTLLMQPVDGPGGGNYRQISFNPYSGRVLRDRQHYSGVLGWMTNLHFYLLAGQTGLLVSGVMALGLLLLCISGVILWWPGVRRWAAGLVLRRRASWQRLNWDIHSVVGFWCSAALLLVCFTGVYFAFPTPVANLMQWATGGKQLETPRADTALANSKLSILSIDRAVETARRSLPSDAPPSYLQLPSGNNPVFSATGYHADSAPYSQLAQVTIDGRTGLVLSHSDTYNEQLGRRIIQYFFTVHFGSFGGPGVLGFAVKGVWVLLGITPGLLAITGLLMYWNRKLRPLWMKWQRRLVTTHSEPVKMIS